MDSISRSTKILVLLTASMQICGSAFGAFQYFKKLTHTAGQSGTGDSASYPISVCTDGVNYGTDANLKTTSNGGFVTNANGYDIKFFSNSNLTGPLNYQLEKYDGSSGIWCGWVQVSNLSVTLDTIFYMGIGDPSISTDGSSNTTWDANFKGVWHFPESGGSIVSPSPDATSFGNNGTVTGATYVAGREDGGASFTAGTQIINMGTGVTDLTSNWTVSGWFNRANGAAGDRFGLYSRWTDPATNRQLFIYFSGLADGKINVDIPFVRNVLLSTTTFAPNSGWNYYFATRSGNNYALYLNGSGTADVTSTFSDTQETGGAVTVGNWVFNTAPANVNGYLDETRIADTARNADWSIADYNSQRASSSFITFGALTSVINRPSYFWMRRG